MDAAGRIAALGKAFQAPTEPDAMAAATGKSWAELAKNIWEQHRRILKSLIGLAVVVAVGWIPVRALLETTSTEAVINARLITLRAPIEGQIGPLAAVAAGSEVQPGAALVSIVNPRAERGRLDDLRRLVDELESEIKTLIARRADLAALHEDLADQTRAFQAARIGPARGAHRRAGKRDRRGRGQARGGTAGPGTRTLARRGGIGDEGVARKGQPRCDSRRADPGCARPSPHGARGRACGPAQGHLRRRQLQ